MQVAGPIDAFQEVAKECGNLVNIEPWVIFTSNDKEILRERKLALTEQCICGGQQLLRPAALAEGSIALAADRQQKRMHSGCVHGVNSVDAVHHGRDDWTRNLVDNPPEAGVFLRRPADNCERPDRILAVIDSFNIQDGKGMRETVIAQM